MDTLNDADFICVRTYRALDRNARSALRFARTRLEHGRSVAAAGACAPGTRCRPAHTGQDCFTDGEALVVPRHAALGSFVHELVALLGFDVDLARFVAVSTELLALFITTRVFVGVVIVVVTARDAEGEQTEERNGENSSKSHVAPIQRVPFPCKPAQAEGP
jgi:hypothetical protein